MKEIYLLIVLTHLAFPAFENAFKFQYLGSNLPNIQHKGKKKFQENGNLKWDSSWILFSEF